MAHWKEKIDISKKWNSVDSENPEEIKELCNEIVSKLKLLRGVDNPLKDIIKVFEDFNPDISTVDDFDVIMDHLYDWADFKNRLWINTFGE